MTRSRLPGHGDSCAAAVAGHALAMVGRRRAPDWNDVDIGNDSRVCALMPAHRCATAGARGRIDPNRNDVDVGIDDDIDGY